MSDVPVTNPDARKKEEKEASAEDAAASRQAKADRERIRRLIICLGDDKTKKVMSQIRGLAGALEDDIEPHGDLIQATLIECVQMLPLKSAFFSAWLARLADKKRSFGERVVQECVTELRTAILTGRILVAQLLLRFIAGLGNAGFLALSEVLDLLEEVFALSDGLRPLKGGDVGVFLMLATLPFLSPAAHEKAAETVETLLSKASVYVASRDAKWKQLVTPWRGDDEPLDGLEASFATVQALKKGGWTSASIIVLPAGEPKVEVPEGMKKAVPPLNISAQDVKKAKLSYQVPLVSMSLSGAGADARPPAADIMPLQDRWTLEGYVVMTIESFARDMEECCKQILGIHVQHPQFEAVVIDVVLSQMLHLPTPAQLPLFYIRLLEHLCAQQSSMQMALDTALRRLFQSMPLMDAEACDTLADVFAYHITHMGWKVDWEAFLGESVSPHTQRFIRNCFERLQRLSFHQNLVQKIPEALHSYIPPEPSTSQLAVVHMAEFEKMATFVRIKDPNDRLVLKYCQLLSRYQDQQKEEAKAPAPAEAEAGEEPGAAEEEAKVNEDEEEVEFGGDEEELKAEEEAEEAEPPAKRARLNEDETSQVKEEDQNKDDEFGTAPVEVWSLQRVAELVIAAVLRHGEKTPTHMNKVLDGNQQVLLELMPKDEEKAHALAKSIAAAVFEFFQLSGHRLEITLDTLYHRGVLTPRAIAQQALAQRDLPESGWVAAWRIIDSMARKILDKMLHSRQGLAEAKATVKAGGTANLEDRKTELDRAVQALNQFFTVIFTGLVRNYNDFKDRDGLLANAMLQRINVIGRRYFDFIYPLIGAADLEERIPEVVEVFHALRSLAS